MILQLTKKFLCLFLAFVLCLSLCACGSEKSTRPEPIQLTNENISNYLEIRGSYTTTHCLKAIGDYIISADLDLQAYSFIPGTFENVEITILIKGKDDVYAWWLEGTEDLEDFKDGHRITISFRMPSTGSFESTYSIECRKKYSSSLVGDCDFKIISVSGTFIPNK